jgi:glycine dehydrogenase subunit 2
MSEKLIFEYSSPGRKGYSLPESDVPEKKIAELVPSRLLRQKENRLPEVSENDAVRHFVRISTLNYHIDKGIYPLGSCTMKYNPKVNELVARFPGWAEIHPFQPEETIQGALKLMYELRNYLAEIGGVDEVTLQPAAGAQGEMTGLLITKAYHEKNKQGHRKKVIIPDSAHGTNPASVATCGYQMVQVKSCANGMVDVEELRKLTDHETAAFMVTNPNTLGIFEANVIEIAKIIHDVGAILYMDGANLNALLGITRPGDMGFDIVHFNLHKTFSTPHGGGGPGAGPIGVKKFLSEYLPIPQVEEKSDKQGRVSYYFDWKKKNTIGKLHSFYGNFGMFVRAYTYIRQHGPEGLRALSENAVINANYLLASLKNYYAVTYDRICMHECVLTGLKQKAKGVRTADIAKRLLDYGVHAPTVYFPLIVPEALMIEPTESESKESLDNFIEAMIRIAKEVETDPELVHSAPHNTPVGRLDEAKAAKELDVCYKG